MIPLQLPLQQKNEAKSAHQVVSRSTPMSTGLHRATGTYHNAACPVDANDLCIRVATNPTKTMNEWSEGKASVGAPPCPLALAQSVIGEWRVVMLLAIGVISCSRDPVEWGSVVEVQGTLSNGAVSLKQRSNTSSTALAATPAQQGQVNQSGIEAHHMFRG